MNAELEVLKDRLRAVRLLKGLPEVAKIFGEKFESLRRDALLKLTGRNLSIDQRNEALDAYHQADALTHFLESEEKAILGSLDRLKK